MACEPVLGPGEALTDPHLAEAGLSVTCREGGHDDVMVTTPISVTPSRPRRHRRAGSTAGPDGDPWGRRSTRRAQGRGLLRVRRGPARRPGARRPRGRRGQGRAAGRRGDAGRRLRGGGGPARQAEHGARSQLAQCHRGGRAAARRGRHRHAQLPARGGRAHRDRRGGGRPAQPESRVLPCQRVRVRRAPGERPGERRVDAGPDRARAGDRRRGERPDRRHLDPHRHVRRVDGRDRRPRRALPGRGDRPRAAGHDQPARAPAWCYRAGATCATAHASGGPRSTAEQTGYGPGYRLYRAGDGGWLALVLESAVVGGPAFPSWFRRAPRGLCPAPRRSGTRPALEAEAVLEKAFASGPAAVWRAVLGSLGVACAVARAARPRPVPARDPRRPRQSAARAGRVLPHGGLGRVRADRPTPALGPTPGRGPRLILPGVGEHTASVLSDLGFAADEIDALLAGGSARQLEPTAG